MRFKKAALAAALTLCGHSAMASGIPTVDLAAITQYILSYVEQISQGVQQATAYALQLKQFENELQRYQELVKQRQLPGVYLYDQVANLRNETMKTLELGSAIAGSISSPENYAKDVLAAYDPRNTPCWKTGNCNYNRLNNDYEQARLSFFNDQTAEIAQDIRNAQQLENYNRQTQQALMNQIRGATSQVQSEQAAAQASAAAAQATNTQTQVMQQLKHKEMVRQMQEEKLRQMEEARVRSLVTVAGKNYNSTTKISSGMYTASARSNGGGSFFFH